MTQVNGHANEVRTRAGEAPPSNGAMLGPVGPPFSHDEIRGWIAKLEIPFDPVVIEWRVINTSKKGGQNRGQVIPYADQRAYTDRLNVLFTPAGWTRSYSVTTSANFQRGEDAKTVAKVFVTCQLTIFGMGTHSATGEEWADDNNAGTSAEAQAFKRACSCFGLGRYLYHFTGVWVDLDDRKRPKKTPQLAGWATPEGWQQGLRPPQQIDHQPSVGREEEPTRAAARGMREEGGNAVALIGQIKAMRKPLGIALYRALLRTVCNVWNPADTRDITLLQKVLAHMKAAQRGLLRLDSAVNTLGSGALERVLRELQLDSLAKVNDLATLKRLVEALEAAVATKART